MDILEVITNLNQLLERYATFRAFKFILAVYLIIIGLDILLMLYIMIVKKGYWNDFSFGRSMPKIIGIMDKRWREVVDMIVGQNPNDYKAAVVEAGDILYQTLKRIGYPGENLTSQLEQMVGYQITNLEGVKDANRIREEIMANAGYKISLQKAREAVVEFGEALKEMEAISDVLV